jgi:acetyl-CoA carboxylase biotin carboxyl carrier protein
MTIEEIKELLRIFNESGVAELELQRGENRLRVRRAGMTQDVVVPAAPVVVAAAAPVPAAAAVAAHVAGAPAAPNVTAKAPEPDSGHVLVKSPIVGTFYEAPSPDAAAFVKVGDSVEVGQVLCIIESMKLMNEIEAEVAGVLEAKLVPNGKPVEYGEALFVIRPV